MKTLSRHLGVVAFGGALLFATTASVGCDGDHDHDHDHDRGHHTSPYPTCDLIIARCHPLDVEEGPIHDCHNLGHDATSDEPCVARRDECLRVCVAPGDAGAQDATGD